MESAGLLRHELRVLVDPSSIDAQTSKDILDIDVLRQYLRDVPGCSHKITLLVPVRASPEFAEVYRFLRFIGVEEIPEAGEVPPEVQAALGSATRDTCMLASTALLKDADVIVTNNERELSHSKEFVNLHVPLGDWDFAKHSCEIFVRGHEIPWSFRNPVWGTPFSAFYPFVEPYFSPLNELYRALYNAVRSNAKLNEALEYGRSLAFNRLSNICYTRDRILFYIQQRHAAARRKWSRQDFSFEAGYYLNHYYLLFWGGLDQICWIVNWVFALGFSQNDWRNVGVTNSEFLRKLKEESEKLYLCFVDEKFLDWFKMLRAARHFVAHKGSAMPTKLLERPEKEPTDEELDREIEAEGMLDFQFLPVPSELLDSLRATLRYGKRIERYKELSDDVMQVELDGNQVLITPLLNTQWDFDHFFDFAVKVAAECTRRLSQG